MKKMVPIAVGKWITAELQLREASGIMIPEQAKENKEMIKLIVLSVGKDVDLGIKINIGDQILATRYHVTRGERYLPEVFVSVHENDLTNILT